MPWIQVVVSTRLDNIEGLVKQVQENAARLLAIDHNEIVVLVMVAEKNSSVGAVVSIVGRDRGSSLEADLALQTRQIVSVAADIPIDLVAVIRH